jgi:hypothetical protein
MTAKALVAFVCGVTFCVASRNCFAQKGRGEVPAIRVEAREVGVPTLVVAKLNGIDYNVLHLSASDFHLLENGKEQEIKKVSLERNYFTDFRDNLGIQHGLAFTPHGKWMRWSDSFFGTWLPGYYYVLAYVPPSSPEGSCHQIRVKVAPRDASGNRLTMAEWGGLNGQKVNVDRRNLLIDSRSQYCNTPHPASDPLYGTKLSKRMERVAVTDKAREGGLLLRAIDLYGESGSARVRVALDFPSIRNQTGIPSFVIALLGTIYRRDGVLAARFSDSDEAGCPFYDVDTDPRVCEETIPNHYETQIALLPGDYDLRVVVSYKHNLWRVEVPISVEDLDDKHLAVSGIALCKRFHQYSETSQTPGQALLQSRTPAPIMPFELVPLVSNGMEFTPTGDTRFKK